METETNENLRYNEIPEQILRRDFNRYINPHLGKQNKETKPKISFYKISNYIHLKDTNQRDISIIYGAGTINGQTRKST